MKTSIVLIDNTTISVKTIYNDATRARRSYENKINDLLSKYDLSWIGNESVVDTSVMSITDVVLYVAYDDSRDRIQQLERQLGMLL